MKCLSLYYDPGAGAACCAFHAIHATFQCAFNISRGVCLAQGKLCKSIGVAATALPRRVWAKVQVTRPWESGVCHPPRSVCRHPSRFSPNAAPDTLAERPKGGAGQRTMGLQDALKNQAVETAAGDPTGPRNARQRDELDDCLIYLRLPPHALSSHPLPPLLSGRRKPLADSVSIFLTPLGKIPTPILCNVFLHIAPNQGERPVCGTRSM